MENIFKEKNMKKKLSKAEKNMNQLKKLFQKNRYRYFK